MALRLASRHLGGLLPASRCLRAFGTEQAASKVAEEELPKPTYTYASPGSSMREPGYNTGHSLGNPAYEYDPKSSGSASSKAAPRAVLGATKKSSTGTQAQSGQEAGNPTYVYAPPGSSMREASYGVSTSDPVYMVDPKPEVPKPTRPPSSVPHTIQPVSPPPPASKVRIGLKADDFANQPYVTSSKGSMHEPRYVSVSDPQDQAHLKK